MTPVLEPGDGPATVLSRLRDVLSREPDLAEEVRKAGTPEAAAETLARIGALRGIATDAAELRTHVARLVAAKTSGQLSDETLDTVVGGVGRADEATWITVLNALLG
jgi:hypothetical protein